ncbi:purine nucleoside phosphorylase I, inosine and guanosine-specific [Talaromyces stipitatus ATCC 10500]|uniref:Purine nucleoside phosphorylase n=1 Tax=Talaromyces stipitatus (strain ATCC 10500 / CBS 375.48 / QM 6759 / NRRL 1006) TaxID=441959 RepID=B8MTR7_TALSN|nr:purine nucleoside phosphorylase I, inosine and guanosine-specific [Talaromyces stipitatus ATCC 10500]EED12552.1 purine nucleoside phosphorylase I, inosine and guanosine-specific [Talaromyces stipitatus ATCC 10500]
MALSTIFSRAQEAATFLRERLDPRLQKPKVAIVCGSGLGGLADAVHEQPRVEIEYSSIPYFPRSTVQGHAGKLLFGFLGTQTSVVLMVGRSHYYEGHSIEDVTFPIRVLKLLEAETIILTNAAGGLNPEYAVGDITLLNDHIFLAGLSGLHPLRGPNVDEFGVRFPPLSDAYDLSLRRCVHTAWQGITKSEKRRLHEGVYAFVSGPSYETRAECRLLRQLGADVVGMSTVPEIIVARHAGMRVLAFSLVTNNAVLTPVPRGDDHLLQSTSSGDLDTILKEGKADHQEVLEAGRQAAQDIQRLVVQVITDVFEKNRDV